MGLVNSLRAMPGLFGKRLGPQGKRAMTLAGGASAAQLIPLAIAPILTRLYSPENYGVFAIFGSVAAVLTAVVAGRYTVAIMLPDNDRDAVQVAGIALSLAAVVSLVLLVLIPIILWLMGGVTIVRTLGLWLYIVPVAAFLASMFESLSYFGLRKDKVGQIAQTNVLKTAISGGSQISLGLLGAGPAGLLGGFLLGLASGNLRLIRVFRESLKAHHLSWSRMKLMAATYSNFPKYDIWGSLANSLAYNVLAIGIGLIYSYHALGQYALAFRSASLPSALVGVSLGQVYLREAARRVDSPTLALRAFYRTVTLLAIVSIVPMTVIGLWGETLFGLIFGPEWRLSGLYASAMMPLVWARFVSSPMSSVFYIYGRQRVLLVFQIVLLTANATTMLVAFSLGSSLHSLLLAQSTVLGAIYIMLLYFARHTIVRSSKT